MPTSHDAGYKLLFSHPDMVRELIQGFVPDDYLHGLDYTTLEKVPGNFVSEELSEREGDVIWRVKAGEEWLYVYLLIEFQSSIDRYMALRMMVYVGLLYQDLLKRKAIGPSGQLPPVLPIVLYNGERRWNAKLDIADLIVEVPGLLHQFKPKLPYLLIDEGSYAGSTGTSVAQSGGMVGRPARFAKGDRQLDFRCADTTPDF